jgi:hypothetical protein
MDHGFGHNDSPVHLALGFVDSGQPVQANDMLCAPTADIGVRGADAFLSDLSLDSIKSICLYCSYNGLAVTR